jgi:hypothetical protein
VYRTNRGGIIPHRWLYVRVLRLLPALGKVCPADFRNVDVLPDIDAPVVAHVASTGGPRRRGGGQAACELVVRGYRSRRKVFPPALHGERELLFRWLAGVDTPEVRVEGGEPPLPASRVVVRVVCARLLSRRRRGCSSRARLSSICSAVIAADADDVVRPYIAWLA